MLNDRPHRAGGVVAALGLAEDERAFHPRRLAVGEALRGGGGGAGGQGHVATFVPRLADEPGRRLVHRVVRVME